MIVRYGMPNKLDQVPKGTICKVILSATDVEYYEQMSQEDEHPCWEQINPIKE